MDKELDDLLDSALNDFGTKIPSSSANNDQQQNQKKSAEKETNNNVTIEKTNLYVDDIDYDDRPPATSLSSSNFTKSKIFSSKISDPNKSNINSTGDDFVKVEDEMKMFEEIFNDEKTKQTMKQFTEAFSMLKTGDDENKAFESFQKAMSTLNFDNSDSEDDEKENIEDDLKFLNSLTANLKSVATPKSEDNEKQTEDNDTLKGEGSLLNKVVNEINKNSKKVFENSSACGSNSNNVGFPFNNDFLSTLTSTDDDDESNFMMEPILSMLFSKEILHPSLKLMLENYDKYIEDGKEKLTEEEIKKSISQRDCIKEMCMIYENSNDSDNKEVKSENLKKILDLLEKCGMPPSELVPEVNPFEALGQGNNSCPIS